MIRAAFAATHASRALGQASVQAQVDMQCGHLGLAVLLFGKTLVASRPAKEWVMTVPRAVRIPSAVVKPRGWFVDCQGSQNVAGLVVAPLLVL